AKDDRSEPTAPKSPSQVRSAALRAFSTYPIESKTPAKGEDFVSSLWRRKRRLISAQNDAARCAVSYFPQKNQAFR
ncbi:MAG: hypothetical protein OIF47_08780, partial [Marinibacterium sp.]|nr:hypothetical protein [Marinibacterium sp.]